MYFDTSYIAKFYLQEPDSERVRELVHGADIIYSSMWAIAEFHSVLHRWVRERVISAESARALASRFAAHTEEGLWNLVPTSEALLRRTGARIISAPPDIFLRTADAVHLMTADEIGHRDVWTNDRHMLAAAPYFGLNGRSV